MNKYLWHAFSFSAFFTRAFEKEIPSYKFKVKGHDVYSTNQFNLIQ